MDDLSRELRKVQKSKQNVSLKMMKENRKSINRIKELNKSDFGSHSKWLENLGRIDPLNITIVLYENRKSHQHYAISLIYFHFSSFHSIRHLPNAFPLPP